jgi:dihydroxyacetone kinase DhaKLM complex PTS-EIIA-like component DhaM
MAKTKEPRKQINFEQLKALMRLKPTQKDTAAFFECSEDTIERIIRKTCDLTFAEFREQNMVHTRFSLIRKAIQKAENGDNVMLIFCLKNLCGWKDKWEQDVDLTMKPFIIKKLNGDEVILGHKAESEEDNG